MKTELYIQREINKKFLMFFHSFMFNTVNSNTNFGVCNSKITEKQIHVQLFQGL